MTATAEIDRVRALVEPIASDLELDLYDVERRGGTIRITLDAAPGSADGVTLDQISLATRLISRELDHEDPIAGRYTLEITSPGIERPLRMPEHFQREIGRQVTVRLRDVVNDERRLEGVLTSADDSSATVRLSSGEEHTVDYQTIDKARTVVDWSTQKKQTKRNAPDTTNGLSGQRSEADTEEKHPS
jgi:ribosome maturation factor RimP